jgi:hypothetical protein
LLARPALQQLLVLYKNTRNSVRSSPVTQAELFDHFDRLSAESCPPNFGAFCIMG